MLQLNPSEHHLMKVRNSSPSSQSLIVKFVLILLASILAKPLSASLSEDWYFSSAYPTQISLNAVWAESENSVYVAGDGGAIFHWNGSSWSEMETPTERPLFSIHRSSNDNIWAVGGDSYQSTNDDRSVVLHYDGSSWQEMPVPVDWAGQRLTLSDVWVQSPTEVWTIIESYLSLFRWDGSQWIDVDFQGSIAGGFVEGSMKDVQWVDDVGLFLIGTHGQILHFDGSTWTLEQQLEQGNFSTNILTTIHAVDADHIYAGHNWGTVYQRNPDGTWTEIPLIPDLAIKPIGFAKSRDEIYFAYASPTNFIGGGRTFITKLRGASAVPEVTGLSSQYDAITSNAAGDIFLLNASGHFLTNREAPSTFASGIVPFIEDTWHGLETAGIQITPSSSLDGHSYFVGWRSPGLVSPELIPAHFQPGQEHWVLNHDNVITEENSPEFRFRFAYEPTLLPPSFDPSRATMLRFDGSVWEPVPAIVNEAEGYMETSTPTATSTWVIAIDQRDPITPSSLSIAAAGTDSITLSWPADVSQTLYSPINLEPGSWVAVPETPTILGDRKTLTISRADHRLFFRLGD
jgi:photosystem II stability/assembly factor-like uncharacterized protein